ncbi:MAG: UDP-2,4-diacetamido-2,4,6-trideoxy-beta-L-altropyranose hydrolase [Methanomicrobiaceae archaeon]|nr:UDP-2,4-diacetamido-2,4,6-trideoxy-beta-L-altropyranose hydrolase [Methanomicrobiaceae archaeon]
MKNKRSVFRVDGSPYIGMGHVMRCLALAQGFFENRIEPVFVMRDMENNSCSLAESCGFHVEMIPDDCSKEEDAEKTLEIARDFGASVIVTDLGYLINASPEVYCKYHDILKKNGHYIVALDVICETEVSADLVVNPYILDENSPIFSFDSDRYLTGPDYFILRDEFRILSVNKRVIRKEAGNILVSFGGSDLRDTTGMIVNALAHADISGLKAEVVVGSGYPVTNIEKLKKIIKLFPDRFELFHDSSNMAEQILKADIAILGGGLTKYEAAALGTPSVIITQFEPEIKPNEDFISAGTAEYIGHIDMINENDIIIEIKNLVEDYPRRVEMSKKGRKLVDGKGIERILSKIPKEVFS